MMGWWDPIPHRWKVVLVILLALVLVAVVVAMLLTIVPYTVECWNLADSRERDGVLLTMLIMIWLTQGWQGRSK